MVLPLTLLSKEARLRKQGIFVEMKTFASTRNHPAFAAIPRAWDLPKARSFLEESLVRDATWDRQDIRAAVKNLARKLDAEWSEWAATRTNVFGLILGDLFDRFMPWLEELPSHIKSGDVCSRFEKLLIAEAESRHTLKFWIDTNVPPPSWFHLSTKEEKVMMNPGHPVIPKSKSKGIPSWRYYHQLAMAGDSDIALEASPEGGWVYV